MKLQSNKKITPWLLCMMLIMTMAFTAVGCSRSNQGNAELPSTEVQSSEETKITVLGEGQTKFLLTVVDKDGNETSFEIHTAKETVGDALSELGLIEGEESEYGLFIKTVNGITADYDTDGTYWAFYINDEYAMSGADSTSIEKDTTYTFKVEK